MKAEILKVAKTVGMAFKNNSPTILTGLGVAGLVTTVIVAIKVAPKAEKAIEEAKKEKKEDEKFTATDYVKASWKFYLPIAAMGASTIGCIIGANSINLRRNAALASLYSLSMESLNEYKDKVKEKVGEQKARTIEEESIADSVKKNPPTDSQVIITGNGDHLCYDKTSGRYFKGNVEMIRRAVNNINEQLYSGETLCLNEFYGELGLDAIDIGYDIGWNHENSLDVKFASILTPENEPCIVMKYDCYPNYKWL